MLRIENHVRNFTNAELQPVVAFESLTLDSFPVDERPVLAALVDDAEDSVFGHDQRMVPGDARVGDDQIFVDFSSYTKRTVIEVNDTLLISLDKHKCGKYSGTGS